MRIYLDLLPQERKEEIKRKKTFWIVVRQEIRFLLPIAFFIAIILAININLKIQLESLEKIYSLEQSRAGYQELKGYEGEFRDVNSKISEISNIQKGHLYWSHVFRELSNLTPAGISISRLITKDYQISLAGEAKTREDLLAFEDKIKASNCFSNIEMPLSNLVSKENVDFQIDFNVQQNCLKQ